ncbi:tRNA nucleotidyltransferase, A-adding [Candidatus Syntrophocurvum alkaliphilum]|uniref:tRNA nucleotidyltransferase, A-adding n=1 Tax=Candidatus Syntrophocurvum alkaliphilum TaxID=2293317 RepID=A0A6I6DI23_9FIRM|nr:CBS domain-containing protein [Candidatus Syntrophocurvum alkaliphilum]QGT99903.1 tRNA nucleotidyltransferase, A-adding [Candidatus Syntrophocurvum alkaliphilum]
MEIITSHNSLDFDGLASIVAAGKLYPAAVKVFSGTLSKNVRQFLALYKDSLEIKSAKEINLNDVDRVIVVDTANANRLGKLKKIIEKKAIDFHVYDHHPSAPDDIKGSVMELHLTGAATTILVEKIIEKEININPFEATILALGIYEDTGSLLFSSTTPRDAYVAAYLLEKGANLAVVANFMERPFTSEQRQILQTLLNSSKHYNINNSDIVIAQAKNNHFIPGLDIVSHRLFEVENCDALFVVAFMEGKIYVIGRSKNNNVKINDILKPLGGRGHEKAASAIIKDNDINKVINIIIEAIKGIVLPGITAKDIMSTPVKTISKDKPMEEAGKLLLRYGHTGMPVVEKDNIVGIISRRDVDKARIHNLEHAPIKGFMTTDVLTISPDTSVNEIQNLMVEYDIGRLPVVEKGRLVGIVSRTDILRTLHGDEFNDDHQMLYTTHDEKIENCNQLLYERLPSKLVTILEIAGQVADEIGSSVYSVGGFVRDLFLNVPNFDIDLVVEGNAKDLAENLASRLGGKARLHERFQTGVVILPDGMKIDVAAARTEYYEFPAALPKVERSSIREDMYRRDFTINTLAICLNPDRFGNLIDYFGGRKDLQAGYIRVLYNFSFVEDPTRILRAIRFEQRYNFKIEPDTFRFATDAVQRRLLGKLSYKRILQELILILSEKDSVSSLERMREIGVWRFILPEVKIEALNKNELRRIPIILGWWKERYYKTNVKGWLIYILVFLATLNKDQVADVLERYPFDKESKKSILELEKVPKALEKINSNYSISPSVIDKLIGNFTLETTVYLLFCIKDETVWEKIVKYIDLKDNIKVEINGHDLKALGLKEGPEFKTILKEIYNLKLDQQISTKAEEIKVVKKWIKEGRIN